MLILADKRKVYFHNPSPISRTCRYNISSSCC